MKPFVLLSVTLGPLLVGSSVLPRSAESSYAPERVQCPKGQDLFRQAQGLSTKEFDWVQGRKRIVYDHFAAYLRRLGLKDFDLEEYLCRLRDYNFKNVPIMAFATSGGGSLSGFTGAGAFGALDDRVPGAIKARTGGLLQSLTYITGQSGGAWPTTAYSAYGFPTAAELLQHWSPWSKHESAADVAVAFVNAGAKYKAGFNVSIADIYGQLDGLSYLPNNGTASFASLAQLPVYKEFNAPLPLVQISEVTNSSAVEYGYKIPAIDGSSTLYEVTPFEFGAWGGDGNPSGFVATKYLGTTLQSGKPVNDACVVNYDHQSLILGWSANAINFWQIEGLSNYTLAPFSKRSVQTDSRPRDKTSITIEARQEQNISGLLEFDKEFFEEFSKLFKLDINSTVYGSLPNPFRGLSNQPAYYSKAKDLSLVDATEVGQALPLWGLIQPARESQFVIAWDGNGDTTYEWNNGTNIYNAYIQATSRKLPFPKVPTVNTILNRGYNLKPVLFGCTANLTNTGKTNAPIIAYMANAPYSAYTNYTFSQQSFTEEFMYEIFTNSFDLVTQGNGTLAEDWPVCLGCATIERSREAVGIARSRQCEACLAKYCWDGSEDDKPASSVVDPTLALFPGVTYQQWNSSSGSYERGI